MVLDFYSVGADEEPVEPEPRRGSLTVWLGLILGVLAPLTFGLTALPGICCAAAALYGGAPRRGQACVGLVLSIASLALPVVLYQQVPAWLWSRPASQGEILAAFDAVGLPPLPTSATDVRLDRFVMPALVCEWLRFEAPAGDCQAYLAGVENSGLTIAAIDLPPLKFMSHVVHRPEWFDLTVIEHGRMVRARLSDEVPVIRVAHDSDRQQVYVFCMRTQP